jgi:hypothetical protein
MYAQTVHLVTEVHHSYQPDEKHLDRQMIKEYMVYYSMGLMWLRLIDIKAKQGRQALTSAEKDLRKGTQDVEFNVPQPIQAFLRQTRNVVDKMGKETEVEIPPLSTAVCHGLGGYHSQQITAQNHNLFEEVPSLGIAGDMLMAASTPVDDPEPHVHVAIPAGSVVTENLVGYSPIVGPRRVEIRQRLNSHGITGNTFPEFVAGTRFDLRYMLSISDII